MDRKVVFTSVVVSFLLIGGSLSARECPSKLNAHNFDITDTLSLGAEIRMFYLGVDVGENLPVSGVVTFDNNYFGGAKLSLTYYPVSELSVVIEGEVRYKNPGWVTNEGFSGRPWQAFLGYDSDTLFANAGLQIFQFGTAALLDERFIGLETGYKNKDFDISLFWGITHNWLLRSTSNCLWVRYTSQTEGWKTISSDLRNYVLGAKYGLKIFKPHQLQLMIMYSHPTFRELQNFSGSIFVKGPIIKKRLSYIIEPLMISSHPEDRYYYVYGIVSELRYHIPVFEREPILTLGTATILNDVPERAINPVYENLSWGFLKRYSLHQGHIGEIKLLWEATNNIHPYANYFLQSKDYTSKNASDELDAGLIFEFMKGLITLNTSFVALNMAGPYIPSYGAYIELRTIIGKE